MPIGESAEHDVESFGKASEKLGDLLGRSLHVRIDRDAHGAACMTQACEKRGVLSKVPRESQDAYARIAPRQLAQLQRRSVGAAIVDQHQLVQPSNLVEDGCGPPMQRG